MTYARLTQDLQSVEVWDAISDESYAALVAANNSKALRHRAQAIDAAPSLTATQAAEFGGYVVEPNMVRHTWRVRDLNAAEIDRQADAGELATLQQAVAALKAGAGTAAERLVRIERVCVWLLKQAAKRGVV
jgi:hypothetical protein